MWINKKKKIQLVNNSNFKIMYVIIFSFNAFVDLNRLNYTKKNLKNRYFVFFLWIFVFTFFSFQDFSFSVYEQKKQISTVLVSLSNIVSLFIIIFKIKITKKTNKWKILE